MFGLNDKFDKLSEEKKNRILKAAMDEFAKYGYDLASTNRIVQSAGIGKGMLFHYFGTKKVLYLDILNYCYDFIIEKFADYIEVASPDIFDRVMGWNNFRIKLFSEYQVVYKICENAIYSPSLEVESEIKELFNTVKEKVYSKFLNGLDTSKFKQGIDINKTIEILTWITDAYINKLLLNYKNKEKDFNQFNNIIISELNQYLNLLKYGIYN